MEQHIPQRSANEKFRTLVVLMDGTGDSIDADVTNIVLLKEMLVGNEKFSGDGSDPRQLVFYVRGIGSPNQGGDPEFDGKKVHTWRSRLHRVYDQAVGSSLHERVQTSYRWLAKNYRDGDKICIFGFSRGAYSARVLAGLINGLGLLDLPPDGSKDDIIATAYDLYDDFADLNHDASKATEDSEDSRWSDLQDRFQTFKTEHRCREPFIEFLGCWDTVNSVNYARSLGHSLQTLFAREKDIKLGFTGTNDSVRTFRHAIALDEHRSKFKQSNWSGPPVQTPDTVKRQGQKKPRVETNVQEVWFAGCHCDIGGGSVLNGTRPNLAHISLRWMIRQTFDMKTGMIFRSDLIRTIGIDPTALYPVYKPRPAIINSVGHAVCTAEIPAIEAQGWGSYLKSWNPFDSEPPRKVFAMQAPALSEDEQDVADAFAPAYDQLTIKPWKWGLLENVPLKKLKATGDGSEHFTWESHQGKGRTIAPLTSQHGNKIKVHWTVQVRMNATFKNGEQKGAKYVPLARIALKEKAGAAGKISFEEACRPGKEYIHWTV